MTCAGRGNRNYIKRNKNCAQSVIRAFLAAGNLPVCTPRGARCGNSGDVPSMVRGHSLHLMRSAFGPNSVI